jgi:localization factor PodJL
MEQMLTDAANSNRELLSELRASLDDVAVRVSALEKNGPSVAEILPPVPEAADVAAQGAPAASESDYLAQARRAAATELAAQEDAASKRKTAAGVGLRKRRAWLRAGAAVGVVLSLGAGGYLLVRQPTLQMTKIAAPPAGKPASLPKPVSAIDQERARADTGDAKAMLALATAYADGAGVAQSASEAAAWLERAALAGEPEAQFRLAKSYESGTGIAADPKQALYWYTEAANRGNSKAMYNLGVFYAGGGPAKDLGEAVRWFKSAAELGLTDAQFNLAVMYEGGLGVEASRPEAYKWYAIGAGGGDADAKTRAGALATQLTAAQKAAADQFVAAFKPKPVTPVTNEVPPVAATGVR